MKKRKSTGVFSCFGKKKVKASIEETSQPIVKTLTNIHNNQQVKSIIDEKPIIDYKILPDGKRIYIDVFHDRPGLDMTYRPTDFDTRFVLPVVRRH